MARRYVYFVWYGIFDGQSTIGEGNTEIFLPERITSHRHVFSAQGLLARDWPRGLQAIIRNYDLLREE